MNFNLSGWRLWVILIVGALIYPVVWLWEKAETAIPKAINWANYHLGGLRDDDCFFD